MRKLGNRIHAEIVEGLVDWPFPDRARLFGLVFGLLRGFSGLLILLPFALIPPLFVDAVDISLAALALSFALLSFALALGRGLPELAISGKVTKLPANTTCSWGHAVFALAGAGRSRGGGRCIVAQAFALAKALGGANGVDGLW